MMLKDKIAVIYEAGGAIDGAVARAFATEGPIFFSPGVAAYRSKRLLGTSFPPADPPRRRRSTLSTSRPCLAGRRMVANKSGVIMTVTSTPSRTGVPFIGGGGPAMAAVEALTRGLSAELAPQGIRVVGLRSQAMPETGRIKESFALYAKAAEMTWEQFQESLAGRTHTRRLSTLEEMANMAVFVADKASGMTGTTVNLTMGTLDD
jgi:NAD(P)-dependent dehydrogenase (short-subunit alcohol dehydrogenase family)